MRNKILSLVIAVTMLFGTASFAFATEGTTADLSTEIATIEAEIDAIQEQIAALTDKAPTVENLEALEAELAELEALYAEAMEGLYLSVGINDRRYFALCQNEGRTSLKIRLLVLDLCASDLYDHSIYSLRRVGDDQIMVLCLGRKHRCDKQ